MDGEEAAKTGSDDVVTETVDEAEETDGGRLSVELAGTLRSEPGPELAGVKVLGNTAAPFKLREFSIISKVVR